MIICSILKQQQWQSALNKIRMFSAICSLKRMRRDKKARWGLLALELCECADCEEFSNLEPAQTSDMSNTTINPKHFLQQEFGPLL